MAPNTSVHVLSFGLRTLAQPGSAGTVSRRYSGSVRHMTSPSLVRTLMGAGSFESSVRCLRSVVACSHEPLKLTVHDDGTLTSELRDRLRSEVTPAISFVERRDADDAVLPRLANYPACLAYRRLAPLALKLFDTAMLSDGPLTFIDSDIFFRRAVTGLFDPEQLGLPAFMDNCTHSYAVRPWRVWPLAKLRLNGRTNSGLIVGWKAGIDLDFTNWVLTRLARDIGYLTRSYWIEQTCWAALAARTECQLFDRRQIVMASPTMSNVTPETVAIHFVSTYRQALADYQDQVPTPGQQPVKMRTIPSRRTSSLGLFWSDFRRRL